MKTRALRWGGAVIGAFALLALPPTPVRVANAPGLRPNVLIIVTDDQRQSLQVMPETVRRFVEHGRRFPQASVTTPLCCPSRASILTGRYAHDHGVLTSKMTHGLDQTTTLEYYLKQQDYRTAIFGKYVNGWGFENPPYFDQWATARSRTYYDGRYLVNGTLKTIPTYSTTYLRRKAVRFIRTSQSGTGQPWFLYLAPFAPHNPFTPQIKYANAAVPKLRDNPAIEEADKSDKPPFVQRRPIRTRRVHTSTKHRNARCCRLTTWLGRSSPLSMPPDRDATRWHSSFPTTACCGESTVSSVSRFPTCSRSRFR